MKKILFVFILALIICASTVFAFDFESLDLNEVKVTANSNADRIPSYIRNRLGSERIVVFVGNSHTYYAIIESGVIDTLEEGIIQNPTFRVHMSETTLDQLTNRELSFPDALGSGAVTIEPIGFWSNVKYFAIKSWLWARGFFS